MAVAHMGAEAAAHARRVAHLNVAFRAPLWSPEVDHRLAAEEAPRPIHLAGPAPTLAPAQAEALALALAAGPDGARGLIVAGPAGAPVEPAHALVVQTLALAERLGWPVVADPASPLRLYGAAQRHPLVISTGDALGRAQIEALAPARVLRLGRSPTSKYLNRWLAGCGAEIHLVDAAGDRHDPHQAARALIQAAPAQACAALTTAVRPLVKAGEITPDPRWAARWQAADQAAAATLGEIADQAPGAPLTEPAVARGLLRALPDGATLHLASSMAIREVDAFGHPALCAAGDQGLTVYASRGANGIDGTYATAVGEAVARPDRPAALLVGDLATLHDAGGLLAAQALLAPAGARLVAVVVENGGGGIFDFLPIAQSEAEQYTRLFRTPQTADLARLCAAAGARYTPVETPAALETTVHAELTDPAPGLCVVGARIGAEAQRDNAAAHQRAFTAAAEVVCAALKAQGVRS